MTSRRSIDSVSENVSYLKEPDTCVPVEKWLDNVIDHANEVLEIYSGIE